MTTTYALAGVTNGSALLRIGADRLLALHDDAFRVTWIRLPAMDLAPLVLRGGGASLPKALKPDFEAAVLAGDTVYVLGSGAAPNRCSIATIDLTAGAIEIVDRPKLYDRMHDALPGGTRPNIEGAVRAGDRLLLFHRGVGTPNAVLELPFGTLSGAEPRVLDTVVVELGAFDGVPLSFTDAALLTDGRIAFVAAAEDAPDAVADGPVTGSVIGVLEDRASAARWTPVTAPDGSPFRAKVEGLAIDASGAWLLTDADDPSRPSLLARVALGGFRE